MLSLEIMSSLEEALFQSWLTDTTFHTHLSMEIIQKTLLKCLHTLNTLQEFCELVASHSCHSCFQPKFPWQQIPVSWPSTKFSYDSTFMSFTPQANFFMTWWLGHPEHKVWDILTVEDQHMGKIMVMENKNNQDITYNNNFWTYKKYCGWIK